VKYFHISQFHEKFGVDGNLSFWVSMIKESQKVIKDNENRIILDFGCGNGKFLHLFDLMDNFKKGYGIDLNKTLIEEANKNNTNSKISYCYSNKEFFDNKKNFFDIVYSQEVIYTIKNLEEHAKLIFSSLKKGGFYFATMGSHIQNPLWSKRREIIKKDYLDGKINYYPYDYSLDEVANIFYNIGFEVGLKRLPVEYFLIYHSKITPEFSNSLYDLVKTTSEHKMLFLFWKPN
jgi:SAM-dependent methyltransferase